MNLEKFKQMTFGQKCQWLLQYYGIAAAAIIVAAVVIIKLLFAMFGPQPQYALRVLILDDKLTLETQQQMKDELSEKLGGEIDLSAFAYGDMYQSQAFTVRLTADELDLVICPQNEMSEMVNNGFIVESEKLEDSSRYCSLSSREKFDENQEYYIGVTVRSNNVDNVPIAMEYFCGN